MITAALHWWQLLFHRSPARAVVARPEVRDELLWQARSEVRAGRLEQAEALVMEYGDAGRSDAACLNVLGVIAEARGQWEEARRFWGKSVRADRRYEPPRQNLRRYFELWHWGRSKWQRALGDEMTLDFSGPRRICRG